MIESDIIVATSAAAGIALISLCAIYYATYSRSGCKCYHPRDIFDNFGRKKYLYILSIICLNIALSLVVFFVIILPSPANELQIIKQQTSTALIAKNESYVLFKTTVLLHMIKGKTSYTSTNVFQRYLIECNKPQFMTNALCFNLSNISAIFRRPVDTTFIRSTVNDILQQTILNGDELDPNIVQYYISQQLKSACKLKMYALSSVCVPTLYAQLCKEVNNTVDVIYTNMKNFYNTTMYQDLHNEYMNMYLQSIDIFTINVTIVLVIYTILKSKDVITSVATTIYAIACYLITCVRKPKPIVEIAIQGNIVSIIPVYSETKEQIEGTIKSIVCHNKCSECKNVLCIICDGKPINIEDSLTQTTLVKDITYESWKHVGNVLHVTYGSIDDVPCIIMKKERNQGKRDTLIIGHDIFNNPRGNIPEINKKMRNEVREDVNHLFHMNDFKYMFCTDADSVIGTDSFKYLIESIERRGAVACCGLVKIDFSEGPWDFWCLFQNYQYLYGQYIRRTLESLYGRVVCLPGCITMFKIHASAAKAIEMYSELPERTHMFKSIVQMLGTDRRLTNSFLFQGKNIKTIMDKRAVCLTIPPNQLYTYLTQRRRWASNSYFNTMTLIVGPNQFIITRLFAILDVTRQSIVYFKVFVTAMFIYGIVLYSDMHSFADVMKKISPCLAIISYPTILFFVICLLHRDIRCMYHKMIIGFIINKVFAMLLSLSVSSNLFWNIGSTIWGANQQSVPPPEVNVLDAPDTSDTIPPQVEEIVVPEMREMQEQQELGEMQVVVT
jgi:cellulose synthase/poly-beta-1,6-N-acetylglucosamine synthase-like glycosyltransferase